MTTPRREAGAYGLAIHGLDGAVRWMQAVPPGAPALRVEAAAAPPQAERPSRLDAGEADLRLVGGARLRMRRGEERVRFMFAEVPGDEDLLHPYLSPAAALAQLWAGREAFHGGAFAAPAGAVVLLAGKEGGKSTTLAWLATEHGAPVLADDLAVVAGGSVLAGPRCLDLRAAPALDLLDLSAARRVRGSDRLRVTLAPAPAELPLAATVVLRWGSRVELEVAPPAERFRLLLRERMYADRVPADQIAVLELAALPMLILTRPPGGAGLRDAAATLLRYLR